MLRKSSDPVTVLGNGQLALAMLDKLKARGFDVVQLCRPEFDITGSRCFQQIHPQTAFVVNCIAYNDVDGAEDDFTGAMAVNLYGVSRLAEFCDKHDIFLVHVSTDYVFDGMYTAPYREDNRPDPVNIYGKSKLAGERVLGVKIPSGRYLIVRTSSLWTNHPARRNNFPYKIMQRALNGQESKVIRGRRMMPTFAPHLAEGIVHLLDFQFANKRSKDRIYHITNSGPVTSWYEFALTFCGAHNVPNHELLVQPTWEWPAKAERPTYSALSSEMFTCRTEHTMPTWLESIEEAAKS